MVYLLSLHVWIYRLKKNNQMVCCHWSNSRRAVSESSVSLDWQKPPWDGAGWSSEAPRETKPPQPLSATMGFTVIVRLTWWLAGPHQWGWFDAKDILRDLSFSFEKVLWSLAILDHLDLFSLGWHVTLATCLGDGLVGCWGWHPWGLAWNRRRIITSLLMVEIPEV